MKVSLGGTTTGITLKTFKLMGKTYEREAYKELDSAPGTPMDSPRSVGISVKSKMMGCGFFALFSKGFALELGKTVSEMEAINIRPAPPGLVRVKMVADLDKWAAIG